MSNGKRARTQKLKASCEARGPRYIPNQGTTYCYCHTLDLQYPHYMAEHTQDHDDARELHARLADGEPQ